jgi:ubiquinone/menaquinone biosynthesis C-methylase UbiE
MNEDKNSTSSKSSRSDKEYARIAKIWDDSIKKYPFRMEVMYPNIIEGLKIQDPNERILDLACGTGYLTHAIGKKARVSGVDRSIEMVEEARHLYPDTDFIQADISALSIEDESIDAISASCAYHYADNVQELSQMLQESARVLKPGGRISGTLTDPDHPVSVWMKGSIRSAEWLDMPLASGSTISINIHDPESGEKLDAFTVHYYRTHDYQKACNLAGLTFEWKDYQPSEEFMRRPDAQAMIDSVQVRLFTAVKK